jgi:hypothetical protein
MAWVTVRNEGESYLYSYLRSGTGTTGEYPPVLPVPRVPTVTVNLLEILRENSLPVLPVFHRYHRSTTGTTGSTVYSEDKFCGKLTYRYYRTFTSTTGQNQYYWSTTGTTARTKTRRTKALPPAGFMPTGTTGCSPVLPVLPGIKHFYKCL